MRRLAVVFTAVVLLTAGFSFGPPARPAEARPSTERTAAVTTIRIVLFARAVLRDLGRAVATTTFPAGGWTRVPAEGR